MKRISVFRFDIISVFRFEIINIENIRQRKNIVMCDPDFHSLW